MSEIPTPTAGQLHKQYQYYVNYFCVWDQSRAQEMTILAVVICILCMGIYLAILAQTYKRERQMKEVKTEYDVETYSIFGIYQLYAIRGVIVIFLIDMFFRMIKMFMGSSFGPAYYTMNQTNGRKYEFKGDLDYSFMEMIDILIDLLDYQFYQLAFIMQIFEWFMINVILDTQKRHASHSSLLENDVSSENEIKEKQVEYKEREIAIYKLMKIVFLSIFISYFLAQIMYYIFLSFVWYFAMWYIIYLGALVYLFLKKEWNVRYFKPFEYQKKRIHEIMFMTCLTLSILFKIKLITSEMSDPYDLMENWEDCYKDPPSTFMFAIHMFWHFLDPRLFLITICFVFIKSPDDCLQGIPELGYLLKSSQAQKIKQESLVRITIGDQDSY